MIETVRNWILCIIGTALICSAVTALTPEGTSKKAVRTVCGFASVIAVLAIAVDFNYADYSSYLSLYRVEADETISDALQKSSQKTRFIIEEECEAYILDKADELGLNVDEVSVTARWSEDGIWYPAGAVLTVSGDDREVEELAALIEAQLGIAKDEQAWSVLDEHT